MPIPQTNANKNAPAPDAARKLGYLARNLIKIKQTINIIVDATIIHGSASGQRLISSKLAINKIDKSIQSLTSSNLCHIRLKISFQFIGCRAGGAFSREPSKVRRFESLRLGVLSHYSGIS